MRATALLLTVFILLVPSVGTAGVPNDPAKVTPLAAGITIPEFSVRNADNSIRHFDAHAFPRPAVLIFYRGGWCPYCNRHLGAIKRVEGEIRRLGFDLLFLSADRPERLYASLSEPNIDYTLLSDAEMQASRALGIAYHLDNASMAKYGEYGVDLEAASGQTHHELPVPAVFIVDTQGVIRFVHANPDYTTRISPEDLLAAARRVANGQP
ncbi:MAG: AhpC/TSA family protein [Proteobacteria bacterium]|nr:AhpC/TSA family protein [Pseudomonadota bacterium]